jgi:hypothetical protein
MQTVEDENLWPTEPVFLLARLEALGEPTSTRVWFAVEQVASQVLGYFDYAGFRPGGFRMALLEAADRADLVNRRMLATAFPLEVGVFAIAKELPGGTSRIARVLHRSSPKHFCGCPVDWLRLANPAAAGPHWARHLGDCPAYGDSGVPRYSGVTQTEG